MPRKYRFSSSSSGADESEDTYAKTPSNNAASYVTRKLIKDLDKREEAQVIELSDESETSKDRKDAPKQKGGKMRPKRYVLSSNDEDSDEDPKPKRKRKVRKKLDSSPEHSLPAHSEIRESESGNSASENSAILESEIVKKKPTKNSPKDKSEKSCKNSPEKSPPKLPEKSPGSLVKSEELVNTVAQKTVAEAVLPETQISAKKPRRKQIVRIIRKPESPEKCEIKPQKVKQIEPEKVESAKLAKAKWKPPRFGNGKSAKTPSERENTDTPSRMGFGLTRQANSPQIVKFKKKDSIST